MCLSCHDGFVLDSRATFAAAHAAHPVGVVPSPRIRQPEAGADPAFPLNDDGKVYCGSCHTAHADEDAASEAPPFMRVGPSDGQLCSGCHADQGGMAGSPHGRVRGAGKPGAPADFEGSGLCGKCHVAHVAKGPLLWAKVPGEGNAQTDRLCRSCHRATGGVGLPARTDHPGEVWAWSQSLRSGMRARSTQEMPVFDKSGHRAVIGQISCATCHDAHGPATAGEGTSTSRTLLRVTDTTEFLCADCHAQRSLLLYRYFHSKATHSH
jgi:predicted CXXCH cytochrome family protein